MSVDNNARTPTTFAEWWQEKYPIFDRDGRDTSMKKKLEEAWNAGRQVVETELAAANEQRKVAEKESADSEQLRYEENRKVCEWMDRALAAESKLEAARAEQIELDAKICDPSESGPQGLLYLERKRLATTIRAQMDTTYKELLCQSMT